VPIRELLLRKREGEKYFNATGTSAGRKGGRNRPNEKIEKIMGQGRAGNRTRKNRTRERPKKGRGGPTHNSARERAENLGRDVKTAKTGGS